MKALSITTLLALSTAIFAQEKPLAGKKPIDKVCLAKPAEQKKKKYLYQASIERRSAHIADTETGGVARLAANTAAAKGEVRAFPNPFNSQIDVIITDGNMSKSVYTATLYDLNGKKVFSEQLLNHQSSLQVGQLAKGVYLLHIDQNGQTIKQEKFVKAE